MLWGEHLKVFFTRCDNSLGVSLKGVAHVVTLKGIVGVAVVKYFQKSAPPWHTTHQKKERKKNNKERQAGVESVETRSDRGDAASPTKSLADGGAAGSKGPNRQAPSKGSKVLALGDQRPRPNRPAGRRGRAPPSGKIKRDPSSSLPPPTITPRCPHSRPGTPAWPPAHSRRRAQAPWCRSLRIPRQPARNWNEGRDGRQPESQSAARKAADFRPEGP